MRATKGKSWGSGLLFFLLAALSTPPATSSLPTIDHALGDPAQALLEDLAGGQAAPERERAPEPSFELFPARVRSALARGPLRYEAPRDLETRVWAINLPGSGQPQAFQLFSPGFAVGVGNSPNLYQFALNSPFNYADPMGLEAVWWNPSTWFGDGESAEVTDREPVVVEQVRPPIYVRIDPIDSSEAWSKQGVEDQLDTAYEIMSEQADVFLYWTGVRSDPEPKETMTEVETDLLLLDAASNYAKEGRESRGIPIYFVRGCSDSPEEGGQSEGVMKPEQRRRAALVYRYFSDTETNEFTSAHELGHTVGGLCDPNEMSRNCRMGAPQPDYGGVMNYPSAYNPDDRTQQGKLNQREVERLREYALTVSSNPQDLR